MGSEMCIRDSDAGVPSHATPPPVLASSNEGHADHVKVSRKQITWMTILSVAVFALAFIAQGKVKAVIDGLPLLSINRAVERIQHRDVASRRALSGLRLGLMPSPSVRPNRNVLSSFRAFSRLSPVSYDQL